MISLLKNQFVRIRYLYSEATTQTSLAASHSDLIKSKSYERGCTLYDKLGTLRKLRRHKKETHLKIKSNAEKQVRELGWFKQKCGN